MRFRYSRQTPEPITTDEYTKGCTPVHLWGQLCAAVRDGPYIERKIIRQQAGAGRVIVKDNANPQSMAVRIS